ncbi:MAG: BMP family ABC transporter substrate-binding protein [Prolixibacteraceae bacterium]|nr:BMP family ABC transporter substrate-binding protein [Prolixibacteraceae bacterium]
MMQNSRGLFNSYLSLLLLIGLIAITTGCEKHGWFNRMKIGMFVYGVGYNDSGWRQNCKNGLLMAHQDYIFDTMFVAETTNLRGEIEYFAVNEYDVMFLGGVVAKNEMLEVAEFYSKMNCVIVDDQYDGDLPNVYSIFFKSDEAAFPLGFLAAAWADMKDGANPVIGIIGGMDIPPIRRFTDAYALGIEHFNKKYNKKVTQALLFIDNFDNESLGYEKAESMIRIQSADVIVPLAGNAGNGAIRAAKDNGKWAIGVDQDQYYSLPEVSDVILSSCIKRADTTIYTVAALFLNEVENIEKVYTGTLANHGVAIAPYHDYEDLIPDTIKTEIETLKEGIINGTVDTGY